MATIKLTERNVTALAAPTASGKQVLYWDEEQKGFGVLCSGVSDAKTFVAQTRIHDSRLKAGDHRPLRATGSRSRKETVEEGQEVLAMMDLGQDPKGARARLTLKEALEALLDGRSKLLGPTALRAIAALGEKYLIDWLEKPLGEITREMVEKKHAEIAADGAGSQKRRGEKRPRSGNAEAAAFRMLRSGNLLYRFVYGGASRENFSNPN